MAEGKSNPYKKPVSSSFGGMSGGSVIRSADQSEGDGEQSFPILVHTDQGPIVLKLTEDCSGDYNAWTVSGDIPQSPFPTESLFCDPKYVLEAIEEGEFTISGTHITLRVRCGTMSGDDINHAEALMKWHEIGRGGYV
jgi:hypothetical protein